MHPCSLSVIVLHSCWAAAVEAGEVSTVGRGRQLPPYETPAPAPQAALTAAQVEGFVLPQCLTRVLSVFRGAELLL